MTCGSLFAQDADPEHRRAVMAEGEGFRLDLGDSVDLLSSWTARDPSLVDSVCLAAFQDAPGGQLPADAMPPESTDWRFDLYAAGWAPVVVKGSTLAGGVKTSFDFGLDTIIDDLEMLIEGGFELTNDRWSIVVWGLYVELKTDVRSEAVLGTIDLRDRTIAVLGEFDTTLDLKESVLDTALYYRVGDWPIGKSDTATWGLDMGGGLRYWHIDVDIDISVLTIGSGQAAVGAIEDFVDPYIGGRILFHFSDGFQGFIRGDYGGFGIGTASRASWMVSAVGRFKLSENVDLVAGYRYLDIDWNKGSGSQEVGFDYYLHGPLVGLSIRF